MLAITLADKLQSFINNLSKRLTKNINASTLNFSSQEPKVAFSFIARITPTGGPDPGRELDELVRIAEENEDQIDTAWFATRIPGSELTINPSSLALIIGPVVAGKPIEAVFANIIGKSDSAPDESSATELYEANVNWKGWWLLKSPKRFQLASLDDIPGLSASNHATARQSFNGQATFVYWDFPSDWPKGDSHKNKEVPSKTNKSQNSFQSDKGNQKPSAKYISTREKCCFYGVDFSGGTEQGGGNSKLWIATWDGKDFLNLECGNDQPNFRRADLPIKIAENPGWWVIDFPFGIPSPIAALEGHNYDCHLKWWAACAAAVAQNNVTEFRQSIKDSAAMAGERWSQRRAVDNEHGTTWFPLFQQLYKQTIYGAGEVLHRLISQQKVSILPWDAGKDSERTKSFVSEGFPGVTLRNLLNHPATGYKGRSDQHFNARVEICRRLSEEHFLPISECVHERAVNDTEGDGVDALVLVLAAKRSQQFGLNNWHDSLQELDNNGRHVEGWFPS